jgi:hypothetical protein
VTIALAFLGGAVFVRVFAWPVLRRWWHDNTPDERTLWPHGATESLGDALERIHPRPGSPLDVCNRILEATEARERAEREHPSSS